MKGLTSVVMVGALVLCAVGCSSDTSTSSTPTSGSGTSATTDRTTTTSLASAFGRGDRYVALGTSIASGFGIPVQSTDCGRSSRDYGALIAAKYHLVLTDVTCGAATIPNVVDTSQGKHPPQIRAVTKDTKLITVTVGGNDIVYNGTAVACGDPRTVCRAPASLESNLARTRAALADMIDKLKSAAPSATIVFVTYPREIPAGNCPALSFTNAEAAVLRDMGAKLEKTFVDVVRPAGVVFVDPYVKPGDHTGCAPASQRWTAGHIAPEGFPYHPTALGHEVMAHMISAALQR